MAMTRKLATVPFAVAVFVFFPYSFLLLPLKCLNIFYAADRLGDLQSKERLRDLRKVLNLQRESEIPDPERSQLERGGLT
jgi:hypothetical protein